MSIIKTAAQWMINLADNNSHGYDQNNRWGPDYDCSSAIISAWQSAGIPVKTEGSTYTGNMRNIFLKCDIKVLQTALNLDFHSNLYIDGIWSIQANMALANHYITKNVTQYLVTAAEILVMLRGFGPEGVESPGISVPD